MKTILFVTIDPIAQRRRVLNTIATAQDTGYKIQVISIGPANSTLNHLPVDYIDVPLKSGPLKFIWFNFILFWRIIFRKFDLIHIRGLWVLPAILLRQILHPSRLIYDAHEYFAGLATFEQRSLVQKFWLSFEQIGISRFDVVTTVSESIAQKYKELYPNLKQIKVLRNVPPFQKPKKIQDAAYLLNSKESIILFHGYFLPQRGLEQLVRAMASVKNARLLLVGEGPLETELKQLVTTLKLAEKVQFRAFVPQDILIDFAAQADVGVSLLEPNSENHRLALPNKFFEYVMAGLPVLVSETPTLKNYVERYEIGLTVNNRKPEAIAKALLKMVADKNQLKKWRQNCLRAAKNLCWEKERSTLFKIYSAL